MKDNIDKREISKGEIKKGDLFLRIKKLGGDNNLHKRKKGILKAKGGTCPF